jgi:2-aminoethylphosphonate-pyruvate transaminase
MTPVTTAVILAAGRGTRLAGEVSDRPKGLLRIGERPIIEESIVSLADAGIQDVILVTGHLAPLYEQFVRRFPAVRTVHNERFADSGSLYSLYQARCLVRGSFLLLESDLVYEPRALATLLEGPDEDAILVSGPTAAGDEVYVAIEAGRLAGMSKRREALAGTIAGELVGITRASPALFELMCRYGEQEFATTLMRDYETDALVAAGKERPIACPVVPDLVWGEIDDASQLARVRERVWPEIERRRRTAVAQAGH